MRVFSFVIQPCFSKRLCFAYSLFFLLLLPGAAQSEITLERMNCDVSASFWRRSLSREKLTYCRLIQRVRINAHENPERAEKYLKQAKALKPRADLGYFEEARLLHLRGNSAAARKVLLSTVAQNLRDYPFYFLLTARVLASVGERSKSAEFYLLSLRSAHLPAKGRPRAQVYLEAALILSSLSAQQAGQSISLLKRARGEDAPFLGPFFGPARRLIQRRATNSRQPGQRTSLALHVPSSVTRKLPLVKAGNPKRAPKQTEYARLKWIFARSDKGRGRSSDIIPVLPPAEPLALLSAAAEQDESFEKAKALHLEFVQRLKALELGPFSPAILLPPMAKPQP